MKAKIRLPVTTACTYYTESQKEDAVVQGNDYFRFLTYSSIFGHI